MAKDILREYGPEHTSPSHSPGHSGVTTDGGKPYNNPSMCYCPPVGPREMHRERPGIGHVEPGYGTKGEGMDYPGEEHTGSPGNHGVNHGNKGTQGRH